MSYVVGFLLSTVETADQIRKVLFPKEVARKEVLVRTVRPNEIVDAARELVQAGAQALITRGGNFNDLQNSGIPVPMVELILGAQDILLELSRVIDRYDAIWLVLSQWVNFDYDRCRSLLPEKVHCFRYSQVAKMQEFLANLDAPDMVACLQRALGGRVPRTVCCRVNPGGAFESENGIIGSPEDSKFGMTPAQLEQAFRELAALGVEEFGIHAFLASNTQVNDYYPRLARQLFEMAADLSARLGVHIGFIDLSGGIGVAYHPDDIPCDLAVIGEGVRKAYEGVLVPAGMGDVAIFSELGRWMLAPAGALVTRVIHEKVTYHDYLGVDACAANLMRPAIYDAYHHVSVMGAEDAPCTHRYNVVGRLCENNDQFARDRLMPECQVGDLLFIHDTGAHGHSMGYNYNGALRSAELLLRCDGSVELIRRAETPADYLATLDV